jgi:hypothetical protein
MEHLERLAKVLRYAGLNLTPQILNLILDENVNELVKTLDTRLKDNPNLSLDDIDEIINAIQEAAQKQAEAEAKKAAAKVNKEKPKLEKA